MILPCVVALVASGLTLFTGFGLGTLLLPAFAVSMDIVDAVAATALVHLLNNLFKLVLVGRAARRELVLWFGLPAMTAALAGALVLAGLGQGEALFTTRLAGFDLAPTPADVVIGLIIVVLAARSLGAGPGPARQAEHGRGVIVRTGLLSGFVGGLSGHQGAVRSAYLLQLDLSRDAFVGTNVAIACLVDIARLAIYGTAARALSREQFALWGPVALCAFLGAFIGARLVSKTTLPGVRRVVALTMILLGVVIAAGML